MPTLVIRHPDGTEQEQEVAEQLSVGRAEGNDLILVEGGVSRQHARFFVEGTGLMVEDVGSANGTFVDGQKIEGPTAVGAKAQVAIGDYEIAVKVGAKARPPAAKAAAKPNSRETNLAVPKAAQAIPRSTRVMTAVKGPAANGAALAKRPKPSASSSGPTLRGLTGAVTGKTFALGGLKVVGRVAGVDIQLEDDSVSRQHAEVEARGKEIAVRDLGSANGTSVNGASISAETILQNGDIVQFGVVELMFETGAGASPGAGKAAVARAPSASSGPSGRAVRARDRDDAQLSGDPQERGAPGAQKKKRLFIAGGAVVGLLFVLVLGKALTSSPADTGVGDGPLKGPGGPRKPVKKDPAAVVEDGLAECRSFASAEAGPPNWKKASEACQKVLDEDPINAEANELIRRIQLEKVCEENLAKGSDLAASGRLDDALEAFAKVKVECPTYFLRTLSVSIEPVAKVKKGAAGDCRTYASNGKWENALKRCEAYMRLACQTMAPDELYPPALTQLKLDGALGKSDWRPKDPLYLNFLRARAKLKPGEPAWQCPEIPAFRPPPPPPDPSRLAKDEFVKRWPEKALADAVTLYFDGKLAEAQVPLQNILINTSKASAHEQAKALLLDIANAANFYQNGITQITNDSPDKADEPFRKVLTIDDRLVLGDKASLPEDQRRREVEKRASFLRRTIVESMASTSYSKGKQLADRKDFLKACKFWKLGISYSRSNNDLLKAAYFCTQKAQKAMDQAGSCDAYKSVLEYAVDGDNLKEEALKKMEEGGCN